MLIKLPFDDPTTTVPQTATLATDDRLPRLFGSTINVGVVVGLAVILFIHWLMTRTAFGLQACGWWGRTRALRCTSACRWAR